MKETIIPIIDGAFGTILKYPENRLEWLEIIYFDLAGELKRVIKHKGDGDTNFIWCTWNGPQRMGGDENQRKNQDNPNQRIVKIAQNTLKCPGDLSRLAVIQIPVKDHQLKLVWNWSKLIIIIIMSDNVLHTRYNHKLLHGILKNGKVESAASELTFAEEKIQRGLF